jgi:hypothetical protein
MASRQQYAIARTASGRLSVQHIVRDFGGVTSCGVTMLRWRIHWSSRPIEELLCQRCARIKAKSAHGRTHLKAVS